MLLVKRPDPGTLKRIVAGLLDRTLSREEVAAWQQAVQLAFGPVDPASTPGYWYFESLAALTVAMALGDGESMFLRDMDLGEYLLDLQQVPCTESVAGITRLRGHQVPPDLVRRPLSMFEHHNPGHLPALGLTPVRGIFDPHRDLVEHCHLRFGPDVYLLVRQYDDQAHLLMVLGSNPDPARLADFLRRLQLA